MDSDDICLKNRIKYSYDFLSNNSKFALVAGKSNTINENDQIINFRKFTLKLNLINCRIFLDNPISHTTIMFRKKFLKNLVVTPKNTSILKILIYYRESLKIIIKLKF